MGEACRPGARDQGVKTPALSHCVVIGVGTGIARAAKYIISRKPGSSRIRTRASTGTGTRTTVALAPALASSVEVQYTVMGIK